MSLSPTKTKKSGDAFSTSMNDNEQNSTSPLHVEGEKQVSPLTSTSTVNVIADQNGETSFNCKLCQNLLHNNRECQHCHSLFCLDHLKQKLKTSPECPSCHKSPVTIDDDYDHNFIVQRIVNETTINCPMGCGAKMQFSELQSHSTSCVKVIVQCPMAKYGCDWTGERGQVRNHAQALCPYQRMKNVLDGYEEKLQQREMIIQQQKKYIEELILKKDMHILHLTRELQHAQSLLQRYGINTSSSHDLSDLNRPQMFTGDLLSDRSQFIIQPNPLHHHSLFGDPINQQPVNQQLSDLIISPSNKSKHIHSPIGSKKNYANAVSSGTSGSSNGFLHPTHHHRFFDDKISHSPINGFNISGDVVDSPDDDLLNDQIVNRVIGDMDDNDHKSSQTENEKEFERQSLDKQLEEEDDSDEGENKFSGTVQHSTEKLATPLDHTGTTPGTTRYLLAGGGVGSIKVWDIQDPEDCIMSLKGHTRFVSALHTHQGRVCSGSGDTSIRLWDFSTGECEKILSGCDGKVGALCSYGNILVSGSKDGATNHKIRLWNTDKGQCLRTLTGHSDWINVLCSHDKMLFSGSGDRTVRIWDLERGKCLVKYENPSFVLSLYHHAGHNLLYCGTYDGMIRTWDLRVSQGKVVKTVKAHGSGVLSLAHHDGLLCSGSKDETIRVWDYRTLGMGAGNTNGTSTSKWGATSNNNNNNNNNNSVRTFVGHNNAVKCLISYNNRYLASGSYDRTVKLWDVTSASVSNDYSSGEDGTNGEDVSVMTIETGFKCYSLSCYEEPNM